MACSKAIPLLIGFFFFFLSLSSPATEAADQPDFYYLTLMWPGAYCNSLGTRCCVPTTGTPAEDFLVEGLFPYDSISGNPLTNCNSTCKFYVNALQKFIGDMYDYWSDITCPSNNGVEKWKSVWCTYGTCSNQTQKVYFNGTLILRKSLELLYVLQDNGIVPSDSAEYSLEGIQNVLMANYGFSTVVECNQDFPLIGNSQLYKIKFCIAADRKTSISCPITVKSNCNSEVKFPPFPFDNALNAAGNPIKMPTAKDVAM